MKRTAYISAIVVAVAVLAATVAQAIREQSLAPVWSIGWMPAVLVGALYAPTRGRCARRGERRRAGE